MNFKDIKPETRDALRAFHAKIGAPSKTRTMALVAAGPPSPLVAVGSSSPGPSPQNARRDRAGRRDKKR